MKYIAIVLLLLIGVSAATENLTWLEGRSVTYLVPRTSALYSNDFSTQDGTVGMVYENFVYIEEIDTWIQSNWIWSLRIPEIRGAT